MRAEIEGVPTLPSSLPPVPFPAAGSHLPPATPEDVSARALRRRGERMRMLRMVVASCAIDAVLLFLLHAAGAVGLLAPIVCLVGGALAGGAFFLMLHGGWSERFADPYLTGPQMLTASGLQLVMVVLAPEIGVLSITIVFIVFAFSALRLTPRQLLPLWVTISLGLALAIGLAGSPPALPCATPWQAALSALWLSMAIGRCAVVGLYGASVRQLLGTRNRELALAQNQLHALATRDELTGALNRRAILGALDDALQAGARPSVALMDLDHFKQVNDGHGHLVGDTALRRFVLGAVRSLRADDRIGRYGGEEFLLLLATSDPPMALAIAERVRRAVAGERWDDVSAGLSITVSIGLATTREGENAEQVLQRADDALYRAKAEGRDRVVAG